MMVLKIILLIISFILTSVGAWRLNDCVKSKEYWIIAYTLIFGGYLMGTVMGWSVFGG